VRVFFLDLFNPFSDNGHGLVSKTLQKNDILKIFSQNTVDPKAYSKQFRNSPRDFGDGSIFGVSELTITAD